MRGFVVFLLLMFFHPSLSSAKNFTLKNLVEYGLMHSFKTKNAKSNLEIQQLQVKNAFSQFLPSLDLTTDFGYNRNILTPASRPVAGMMTLTLTEIIYNNGINLTSYSIAKQEVRRSLIEYTRDQNQLCLDIVREYNSYSLLNHLLEAKNSQYQLLLQQSQSMENQYRNGERTRIDFLRFQSQTQRTMLSISNTKTDIQQSIERIKSIIGFKDQQMDVVPMKIEESHEPVVLDNIEDILKNHYEQKIANYSKNISQKQLDMEKRKYWPQVTLNGSLSYINPNYMSPFPRGGYPLDLSAFVTLQYNLWDWGLRKRNVSIAQARNYIANNNIDANLLLLRTQIQRLLLNIRKQANNLHVNQELVALERENYDSIARDYQNGQLTFLDLISAFNNYTIAQESYYTSFFNLQTFVLEYKYHKGDLYESLFDR